MKVLLCLFFMGLLSGCSTFSYLLQAGRGQLDLMSRNRPIAEVLQDPSVPEHTKKLLSQIPDMKAFAQLNALNATENYERYVDVGRPSVVWVVSACEPLSFDERVWKFPVVGSFNYLGWYSEERAQGHATELRKEGLDVYVRGASAYSTLGWFRDPVFSTMLPEEETAVGSLANVVIHESVHATVYVKNQSYFNESLASFVGDRLALTYLQSRFGEQSKEIQAYNQYEKFQDLRTKRFYGAYNELKAIYDSGDAAEVKLQKKAAVLDRLKAELKINKEINNATLVQFKTYGTGEEQFEALFRACGGKWDRFIATLKNVREEDFTAEQTQDFGGVLKRGC